MTTLTADEQAARQEIIDAHELINQLYMSQLHLPGQMVKAGLYARKIMGEDPDSPQIDIGELDHDSLADFLRDVLISAGVSGDMFQVGHTALMSWAYNGSYVSSLTTKQYLHRILVTCISAPVNHV